MRIGLPFVLLLFLLSCANERAKTSAVANSTALSTQDTLSYTYHTKKEISPYFVGDSVHIDTAYYQNTYPIFEHARIDSALHAAIFIDRENNVDEAARAFLDGFNEYVEDNNTSSIPVAWYKDAYSSIVLNTPLFLTLKTSINEYSGGAHGNHVTLYAVYDLNNLQKITLDDLISAGKKQQLSTLAEHQFRKQENIADSASLAKDFFFEDGIFALNDNFGLTKNGLIIYYNEYEIKPYSKGITIIELPYEDISGILNARGKRYVNNIQQ